MAYDIERYPARSGRIIGEDGQVYNIVDLLRSAGGGSSMEFHFGTGAPESSLGANGDVYLNTSNGYFYKKESDSWTSVSNLKGPQGEQGPQGQQGPEGPQGPAGADGVGIEDITSDGENITFHLTDGTTRVIPWPSQGGE